MRFKKIMALLTAGSMIVSSNFVFAMENSRAINSSSSYDTTFPFGVYTFTATGVCISTQAFEGTSAWNNRSGGTSISAETYQKDHETGLYYSVEIGEESGGMSCSIDQNHVDYQYQGLYTIGKVQFMHYGNNSIALVEE